MVKTYKKKAVKRSGASKRIQKGSSKFGTPVVSTFRSSITPRQAQEAMSQIISKLESRQKILKEEISSLMRMRFQGRRPRPDLSAQQNYKQAELRRVVSIIDQAKSIKGVPTIEQITAIKNLERENNMLVESEAFMAKQVVDPFMAEKVVDPFMAEKVVDPFMAKKVVDPFMAEKVVDPFMAKQVVDPFTTPTSANYARMLQASSAQIKSNLSRSKGGKRRTRKQRR
jgi:hypothetical protein